MSKLKSDLKDIVSFMRGAGLDHISANKIQAAIAQLTRLEASVESCSLRNSTDVDRIAELEAQLKTAKRDGILEAVDKITGYLVIDEYQSDWVYSSDDLVEYANNLTGE